MMGADLQYRQDTDFPRYAVEMDLLQATSGLLEDGKALASAVLIALSSDARAGETEILPDLDSDDRRGWWGDYQAEDIWSGWPVGSRLWLLERAKIVGAQDVEGATLDRAIAYAREALQPFIDAKIASRVEVTGARTDTNRIDLQIILYRGPLPSIELRYSSLWDA